MFLHCCLSIFLTCPAVEIDTVETHFVQVCPQRDDGLERSSGQTHAVVLVHGLRTWADGDDVPRALFEDWQKPGSRMVKRMGKEADVYAFAYGQDKTPSLVARTASLRTDIRSLKDLGYSEIVLVGYSAGGLIVRQFVEDFPDAGVTKVIQVCAPNGGCPLVGDVAAHKSQQDFLQVLSKKSREKAMRERVGIKVPAGIQFVCVAGTVGESGDGAVPLRSQWSPDLQEQGIAMVPLAVAHFAVMKDKAAVNEIAELIRKDCPRVSGR